MPTERDPRAALLKTEVVVSDVTDDVREKIIEIAVLAVELHVLVPTKKTWNNDEKKLLEREIERTSMQAIARYIKREVDRELGASWHVAYGRSFATYTTYERQHFLHFKLDEADVVVWKHG